MFNGIVQETGDITDINLNKKSYITFVTKLNLKDYFSYLEKKYVEYRDSDEESFAIFLKKKEQI